MRQFDAETPHPWYETMLFSLHGITFHFTALLFSLILFSADQWGNDWDHFHYGCIYLRSLHFAHRKKKVIVYHSVWCKTLSPAYTHFATVLQQIDATVSSVISEVCCNIITHPPCNNHKSNTTTHTLRLLQGGCMIVLQQTSLITLEIVATFWCSTVARWVYARL